MKQFFSKKNAVTLEEENGVFVIKKVFSSAETLRRELAVYALLAGGKGQALCPRVLNVDGNAVTLEYIEGETLLAALESAERADSDITPLFMALAEWLLAFNRQTGLAMGDVNLRNFLVCDGHVYGIDFEDAAPGDPLNDLALALAYASTYDPPLTPYKTALAKSVLAKYPAAREKYAQALAARKRRLRLE